MNRFFPLSVRVARVSKQAALVALGAVALSISSVDASARLPEHQRRVDFQDLDLAKSQDVQALYKRLRLASEAVCGDLNTYQPVRVQKRVRQCRADALANAVAAVGNPSLLAVHAAKHDTKVAQRKTEGPSKS